MFLPFVGALGSPVRQPGPRAAAGTATLTGRIASAAAPRHPPRTASLDPVPEPLNGRLYATIIE